MIHRKLDEMIYNLYHSKILLKEKADDLDKTNVMDPELFKQFDFRLTRCRTTLYRDYPWFGLMLSKLKTVPTNDVPTMAVDNFGNIYMNPEFTMSMTEQETLGVLCHECMHIMTLSFFRQKSRDMEWWNIATDFVMNRDLVEMNLALPEGGCIPEQVGGSFFARIPGAPGSGKPYALDVDITDMSAEELYHEIEKAVEKDEKSKTDKNGKGKPGPKTYKAGDRVQSRTTGKNGTVKKVTGPQGNQTLDIEWDKEMNESVQTGVSSKDVMPLLSGTIEQGEGGENMGKEGEDFALDKDAVIKPKAGSKKADIKGSLKDILDELAKKREQFDKHITSTQAKPTPLETPNGDPDYQPNIGDEKSAESKLKDKVQSTITALQGGKGRGSGEGGPRSLRKEIFQTKTNWKNLLRTFLSGSEKTRPTWSKPKKRAYASGYYAPGLRKEFTKIEMVVAIDTSGSISDSTIGLFTSEILNITKAYPKVQIKLIFWHGHVYGDIDLNAATSSQKQISDVLHNINYEAGGTNLSSVANYLNEHYPNKKFGGLVVFTDGVVESSPKFIDTKNKLFLLTPGGTKSILEKYGPTYEIDVHN